MMHRSLVSVMLMLLTLAACEAQQRASVTRPQFQELRWLVGVWRGSGGAYLAFFEEYRLVNDSTIRMRAFADSTLSVVSDSSTIAWRDGAVESRSARSVYDAVEVTPTSIRFARRGDERGGHTFTRVSADEWTATLDPAAPEGQPTVYVMRRIQQ
jgi:hypothetical protein